jgi:WD40 repeat protein
MTALEVKNYVRATLVAARTIAQEILVFDELVDFITSSITTGIPAWTAALTFNLDGSGAGSFSTLPDTDGNLRFWKTKTSANINNSPPTNPATTENTYWIEVSPSSGSAIKEWAAGVYGTGLVIVFYNNELYKLEEATRPYNSTNIATEIGAGDWVKISVSTAGVYIAANSDTTAAPIILDSALYTDILFNGSGTISTNKTLQFNNDGNGRRKKLLFTISGTPVLTLPSSCKMQPWQSGWDDGAKTIDFAALGAGDYELEFTWKTIGTYFQTKLSGPF